ncbi:hypothetical protein O7606_23840 [Micromonospora sp. WMMD882]|uniref:hypothetical protein n=1 Tax=Micromonospora sp. WMMD882 TaxID=3015151 RepID=UPI00248CAD50|nr:hypothetical protein [Micromonospora sp. WMMD882]WBB79177.1 hypothetical protein O7606_23840 [Micromonospora sp. WMMD882]
MVYRYESDEDATAGFPGHEADPEAPDARRAPAPTGPSPSRFPPPALPRTPDPAPGFGGPPVGGTEPAGRFATEPVRYDDPARTARRPPRPRGSGGRLWQALLGAAAVLMLLGLGGLGTAVYLAERDNTPGPAEPSAPPAAARTDAPDETDLDSRDTDPLPLTAKEVFPGSQLVVDRGRPAYQVLRTQSSGSCAVAATDDIADLLVRLGCNQVVRGTLRTSDEKYLATAGLFNVTDRATADRVQERIREILQQQRGRFNGLVSEDEDEDTEALGAAPARVSWQARGHYVAYCMVVRADGEALDPADQNARQVLADLVQTHLDKTVLGRRAAPDPDLTQDGPTHRPDPND